MNKSAATPVTSENGHIPAGLELIQSEMPVGQKTMVYQDPKQDVVDDELFTAAEAAAFYKVTLRTLEEWRRFKKGPRFVRVGNGVRYWRSDLMSFIQDQG